MSTYIHLDPNSAEIDDMIDANARITEALTAIEELKRNGYSFAYWDVTTYSSAMNQPTAAFQQSVYPPDFHKLHEENVFVGHGHSFTEAVLNAVHHFNQKH